MGSPSPKHKKLFPQKLWDLIHDDKFQFCIRWNSDGQLVYLNRDEFEQNYLRTPQNQFHTQKAISFVRQMNMYGFRKVDDCYYENDHFKRNRHHLLARMVRKHPNKLGELDGDSSSRSPTLADLELDEQDLDADEGALEPEPRDCASPASSRSDSAAASDVGVASDEEPERSARFRRHSQRQAASAFAKRASATSGAPAELVPLAQHRPAAAAPPPASAAAAASAAHAQSAQNPQNPQSRQLSPQAGQPHKAAQSQPKPHPLLPAAAFGYGERKADAFQAILQAQQQHLHGYGAHPAIEAYLAQAKAAAGTSGLEQPAGAAAFYALLQNAGGALYQQQQQAQAQAQAQAAAQAQAQAQSHLMGGQAALRVQQVQQVYQQLIAQQLSSQHHHLQQQQLNHQQQQHQHLQQQQQQQHQQVHLSQLQRHHQMMTSNGNGNANANANATGAANSSSAAATGSGSHSSGSSTSSQHEAIQAQGGRASPSSMQRRPDATKPMKKRAIESLDCNSNTNATPTAASPRQRRPSGVEQAASKRPRRSEDPKSPLVETRGQPAKEAQEFARSLVLQVATGRDFRLDPKAVSEASRYAERFVEFLLDTAQSATREQTNSNSTTTTSTSTTNNNSDSENDNTTSLSQSGQNGEQSLRASLRSHKFQQQHQATNSSTVSLADLNCAIKAMPSSLSSVLSRQLA